MLTPEQIHEALKQVKYPGYSRDIVSFGLVKQIDANQGAVTVSLELANASPELAAQLKREIEIVLRNLGAKTCFVQINTRGGPPVSALGAAPKPSGLRRIIAVASGKGGVGKSTVSVNLACALKHLGARVGLLDCDIYGPSVPLMMGVTGRPAVSDENQLLPQENYGIKLMSMGFFLDDDSPVIWRGPMIVKTIKQFFSDVAWGELDFLVVDLPPGTGDAQLTLCQTVPLDGGVVVTTPQEASLGVVRKGIAMFRKVHVPILGIVENMSYFTSPNGERLEIFGHGGGKHEAARQNVPFLGEIPLYTEIRVGGDEGLPVTVADAGSAAAQPFVNIARHLMQTLAENKG